MQSSPVRQAKICRRRAPVCALFLTLVLAAISLAGCSSGPPENHDFVYVAVPEASLRDRVATVYNKTGLVHNGERLVVLERMQNRRFVRVRTPRGEEGWIQDRYLADQETYNQFARMAQKFKSAPAQSFATTLDQVKVHDEPGRKAGYLYLLDGNVKVDLLERRAVPRYGVVTPAAENKDKDTDSDDDQDKTAQPQFMEDWWLIRDGQNRVGWVYGRTLYVEAPDDIAQYSEGQRIVALYKLDEVQDGGKKVPEYLVLFTEPKDGMPYDFNQIRVFTWNLKKHRYETAYREHNLTGFLPVTLGMQDLGKEGNLQTFTLHLKDEDGKERQQIYTFNPPIVRKYYAPGQEPPSKVKKKRAGATPRAHHAWV
ncbi:MAG TPA: SH3 domain-containing protein [Candidatus Angelobacter sp.]|nr:SH3 domain-containing protein [Candidatus Angelobacter sp.]